MDEIGGVTENRGVPRSVLDLVRQMPVYSALLQVQSTREHDRDGSFKQRGADVSS